jgi:hypothetical protein
MRRGTTRSLMASRRTSRSRLRMAMAVRQHEDDWWTGVRELLAKLRPGDTMEATVRSVDGGRALLRILGTEVWADSVAALEPGERVLVVVEAVTPVTVVRVVGELQEAHLGGDAGVVA